MKRSTSKEDYKIPTIDLEKGKLDNEKFDNGPIKPKTKHPKFYQNLFNYFNEYTSNTSLHGVQYFGERDRHPLEKLAWIAIFITSIYFCTSLIIKTYEKWELSPVIVSFARSPTPVWQIPFPAVTICSETKSRQSKFNFTYYYHKDLKESGNMTEEELKKYSDISLVCDSHLYHGGDNITNETTMEFLKEVAPPFSDVLWICKWTNLNETCDHLFTPMLTEEGICFTFNMLDRSELFTDALGTDKSYMSHNRRSEGWTLENGYPPETEKNTFPRRALSAGARAGLAILMRAYDYDLDYVCRGPVQGFKILLHHPAEIPRVSNQYFRAPLNQEVVVSIKPDMMTTSDGLRSYDPHRRQCYFPSERQLMFFRSYTQQNCELECLTNFTLKRCGCVAYHMPREAKVPICGSGNVICMHEAQVELLAKEVDSGLTKRNTESVDDLDEGECDCLPSCTTLSYNAETSQADFDWYKLFQAFKANTSEFPGVQMTRITLFFKEQQFITSERNELYGQTDFLANCGGLLGLFTGFSFLSIVELFYFLTLRLMCNVKRYGFHFWSGSEELIEKSKDHDR